MPGRQPTSSERKSGAAAQGLRPELLPGRSDGGVQGLENAVIRLAGAWTKYGDEKCLRNTSCKPAMFFNRQTARGIQFAIDGGIQKIFSFIARHSLAFEPGKPEVACAPEWSATSN